MAKKKKNSEKIKRTRKAKARVIILYICPNEIFYGNDGQKESRPRARARAKAKARARAGEIDRERGQM